MGLDANLVVIKKTDFEIYEQKQAEYSEVARQRSKIINSVINPIYKELTDKYPDYEAFENANDPKINKYIKEMIISACFQMWGIICIPTRIYLMRILSAQIIDMRTVKNISPLVCSFIKLLRFIAFLITSID